MLQITGKWILPPYYLVDSSLFCLLFDKLTTCTTDDMSSYVLEILNSDSVEFLDRKEEVIQAVKEMFGPCIFNSRNYHNHILTTISDTQHTFSNLMTTFNANLPLKNEGRSTENVQVALKVNPHKDLPIYRHLVDIKQHILNNSVTLINGETGMK
jgi:HrpA-like RNA helicase